MSSKFSTDLSDAPEARLAGIEPIRWRLGLRQLLALILYCGLFFWLVSIAFVPLLVGCLIFVAVGAGTSGFLIERRRSTQQDALVAILAVAAEREIPLAPALDAVSDQFTRGYRLKVRALAHHMKAGASLSQALERVPGALSGPVEIMARVGSDLGTLAAALREAAVERHGPHAASKALIDRILYVLGVVFVIQIINGFLFFYILPRYKAILADYGLIVPWPTMLLIQAGALIQSWWMVYLGALIGQVLCFFLVWDFTLILGGRTSRIKNSLSDRLLSRGHNALVMKSLAWVVEGNVPISRGIEILRTDHTSAWVKTRLGRVLLDVKHGSDWIDSLFHHGFLGKSDVAILESARHVGNLPWALREAAMSSERRSVAQLEAWLQLLTPLVLIGLGSIVLLVCVAYFAPLLTILEVLA